MKKLGSEERLNLKKSVNTLPVMQKPVIWIFTFL